MTCSSCGSDVPAGGRFCPNCGTSQASGDEERRVVTALFADLVGFTTLSEHLDPEEVKHLVDRCFERLARDITTFGGVVDKILGDGVVALFGAPVAHEDDAERAVRAGLRMQQSLVALSRDLDVEIQMRIGINTGEVLVGLSSAGGDYTAMGDVMNAASRLETSADPGQVLVGPATHAATSEAISYRHIGPVQVRGRDEIDTWAALSAVRPPGLRTRRSSAFIGRSHELDLLVSQARLAFETERAQASVIVGEAGIGKTRLVEEVAGVLSSKWGARVLEGRTVPYGEANVWWPIAELVRRAFNLTHDSPQDEAEITITHSLEVHFSVGPDSPPKVSDADIARYTTALLHALGYETPLRGGDRLRNRGEVTLAMTRLLEQELIARPVVLILSDIHWAAEAVLGLINRLFVDLNRKPLIVLMTARPGDLPDVIEGRHGSLVLPLGPLDAAAGRDLVAQLAADLPQDEIDELVERSGGNPFFLEELSNLVASDSFDSQSRTVAELASGRLDLLPDTLRGIVSARLDALDPKTRTTLEAASVLGRSGPVDALRILIREVNGWDSIADELVALNDAELLTVVDSRFEFPSNMIRDVAYGTLTKTVRANMHAGIAGYLEGQVGSGRVRNSTAVAIATQAHAAALLVNELNDVDGVDRADINARALKWIGEAGKRALDAGEPSEAERWFSHGLTLATDGELRSTFRYGRAKARSEVRDLTGARSDLDRLEPHLAHNEHLAAKALLVRGDVDSKAGDLDLAAARLREAADRLEVLGDSSEQSLALRLLGVAEAYRDSHLAHQALESARAVAAAAGDRRGEAWAVQTLAWFWLRSGHLNDADLLTKEADQIFSELEDRGGMALTRGVEAWVAFHRGDRDRARALMTEVLPEVRRRGDPWTEAVALNLLGSVELWAGRAGLALDLAVESGAVAEDAEDLSLVVDAKLLAGRAMVSRGNVVDGSAALEEAFADADDAGDAAARRRAIIVNASSAARLGESERAIRWAARYDGNHEDIAVVGERDLLVSVALALLQRGAVDEAASQLAWLDEAPEIGAPSLATSGDSNSGFAMAVKAVVAAAQGRGSDGLELVEKLLVGTSTYLDRVLGHLAAVAIHQQAGRTDQVTEELGRARALVASTDDRLTPLLIELVAALCDRGDLRAAESVLASRGVDPSGWTTLWRRAIDPTFVS